MMRAALVTMVISFGCGPAQPAAQPPPPGPGPAPAPGPAADPAGPATKEALFSEVAAGLAARDHTRWVKVAATLAVAEKFCPSVFEDPKRRAQVERDLAGVPESLRKAMDECWEDGDLGKVTLTAVVRNEVDPDGHGCPGVPMGEAVLAVGQPARHVEVEYVVTGDGVYLIDDPECEEDEGDDDDDDDDDTDA